MLKRLLNALRPMTAVVTAYSLLLTLTPHASAQLGTIPTSYIPQTYRTAIGLDVIQDLPSLDVATNAAVLQFQNQALITYLTARGMTNFAGMEPYLQPGMPYNLPTLPQPDNDITRMVYNDRATARAAVLQGGLWRFAGRHPAVPPFREYGLAEADQAFNTPGGSAAAANAAEALTTAIAPFAAGGIGAVLVVEGLLTPVLTDIFSFTVLVDGVAEDIALALPGFAEAAAGPFVVVVIAAEAFVTQLLSTLSFDKVGSDLQKDLNTAANTPVDFSSVLKNTKGTQELYAAFISATLFVGANNIDPVSPIPVVHPTSVSWFVHTPVSLLPLHEASIINYQTWDGSPQSAQLSCGWFYRTPLNGGTYSVSDKIEYVTWEGIRFTAQWLGNQFLHVSADGKTVAYSNYMHYRANDGSFWTAYLYSASPYNSNTPPVNFVSSGGSNKGTTGPQLLLQGWNSTNQSVLYPYYAVQGIFLPMSQAGQLNAQTIFQLQGALPYKSWDGTDWYLVVNPDGSVANVKADYSQVLSGTYANVLGTQGAHWTYTVAH